VQDKPAGDATKKDEPIDDKKKKKEPPPPAVGLFSLWRFAERLDLAIVLTGVFFSVGIGALMPVQILIFGNLVSDLPTALADGGDVLGILLVPIKIIVCLGAGMLVGGYIAQCSWVYSGEKQVKKIRELYVHSILRQDMEWFDKAEDGSLSTRLANDTQLIQDAISEKAGATLQGVSQFLTGLIIAFVKGWRLALVILACMPLLAIMGGIMMILLTKFMTGGQDAYAEAGKVAEQALGGIKTVYAFSLQKRFQARYDVLLEKAKQINTKAGFVIGLGFGVFMFILFSCYGLAFWYGSKMVHDGTDGMDGGRVLTVFLALVVGAMSLMQMAPNLSAFGSGRAAAFKVFQTIDRVPSIDTDNESGSRPATINGAITFEGVKFNYPTRPDIPILKNLTLEVKPGTTVAFVGPSGSGKSTSVSLVQRFYDPLAGRVTLDGVDLKDLDVKWLRRQIGVVSQEPVLFNMTIKDNLLQGMVERVPSDAEIEEACRKANCHNFITQLPRGYETIVGDHGGMMSGGQKQRIAIARALLKDPRILLLDEATSALDTASERLVQKALDAAAKNRTTIVIAHRLSTIRNADLIVVMDKGDLIEKGTHDELYAMGGVYTQLVNKQKIKMKSDEVHDMPLDDAALEEELAKEREHLAQKIATSNGEETIITMDGVERVKSARQIKEEAQEAKMQARAPLARVVRMMAPDVHLLILGATAAMFAGAIFPGYGLVFSKVITILSVPVNMSPEYTGLGGPYLYAFLFSIIGIGAFLSISTQVICFETAGARLTKKVRAQTFAALLRQEAGFFDLEGNSQGALTSALATDAAGVSEMVTKVWGDAIQLFSSAITGLVISFIYSWKLSLVLMAAMPFVLGAAALEARVHQGFEDKTKKAYALSGEVASEAIKEIRTVKSLTREKFWEERYAKEIVGPHKLALRKAYLASLGYGAQQGFNMWTTALGFYAGIRFYLAGMARFEDIFVVLLVILMTSSTMGRTSLFVAKFAKGKHCAINTFELLDRKTLIDPENHHDEELGDVTGDIELKDIAFRYPARPDIPIFSGQFGFSAKSRQTVALVGPSGCGKSTSIGMLERWYDPLAGTVKVDGKNTKGLQVKSLRRDMALVGQEPVLFDMTIRENLLFGSDREDVTQEEIEEAARLANIHGFVSGLPDGYETRVGDKGSQLSGGQKQRIAIARALVRKPKILLLDEATSALDSESEKLVQEALDRAVEGRTTITIAHRLSTIQNADCICVVKDGRVVESGKHFELLELGGVYKELVEQQDLNSLAQ